MELNDFLIFFPLSSSDLIDFADAKLQGVKRVVSAIAKNTRTRSTTQIYADILQKTKVQKRTAMQLESRIQPTRNRPPIQISHFGINVVVGNLYKDLTDSNIFGQFCPHPCHHGDGSCLAAKKLQAYAESKYHVMENIDYVKFASAPRKVGQYQTNLTIIYEEQEEEIENLMIKGRHLVLEANN